MSDPGPDRDARRTLLLMGASNPRKGKEKMARKLGLSCLTVAVALLMLGNAAQAGILGNPTGTMGKGKASLGLEYDYRRGLTTNETALGSFPSNEMGFNSNRYLARAGLGVLDWMDLYFRIGAGDLYFPRNEPGDPTFYGSTRLAVGGGFSLRIFETDREGLNARAVLIGQGLRYGSHGNLRVPIENTSDSFRAYHNEYTWNEIDAGFLLAFTTPPVAPGKNLHFTPYVGVEKTWVDGDIDRTEFLIAGGQRSLRGMENVEFADDGLTVRPVMGIEINMPESYTITFEMTVLDKDEFSFGVGINQVLPLKRTYVREKAADHRM